MTGDHRRVAAVMALTAGLVVVVVLLVGTVAPAAHRTRTVDACVATAQLDRSFDLSWLFGQATTVPAGDCPTDGDREGR